MWLRATPDNLAAARIKGTKPAGVRVAVVSDALFHRQSLIAILQSRSMSVIADAPRLADLPSVASDTVVLIDAASTGAASALHELCRRAEETRVVVAGVDLTQDDAISCAEAGVVGIVGRTGSIDELVSALGRAADGEGWCPPEIAATIFRRCQAVGVGGTEDPSLTRRQREIVRLLRRGLSNKEIAAELCIQLPTVKNHVHAILEKLNVSRRDDVARSVATD